MNLNQDTLKILEDLQKNIISWYPFEENSTILEIGTHCAELTDRLSDGKRDVVSIAFQKEIKEDVETKIKNKDNINIILSNTEDITLEKQFDYITLIGIIEHSEEMFKKTPENLIEYLKKFLKDDGKFLIATDNRLGINNLCTEAKENNDKLLSRIKIEEILDKQGLVNRKFYYPLPNYTLPNVIFTDAYLPDTETINRCLTFYDDNTICALDEIKRFKTILEEEPEMFMKCANSFFIECSCNKIKENDIKFVAFSNIRKPKYRIQTIIQGENVYKYNLSEISKPHLEEIKSNIDILKASDLKTVDGYDKNKIISKYQHGVLTLDRIIIQKLKDNLDSEAMKLITEFKNELISKLKKSENSKNVFDKYNIIYNKEDIENLNFVKDGLWDLNFKNCFYKNNELYFYDQEWIENDVPIEFMLYRSILYFPELTKLIENNKIYDKLGFTENQIQLFTNLDNVLQELTREPAIWDIHSQGRSSYDLSSKIEKLQQDKEKIFSDAQELLLQKDGRIRVLEDGMAEAIDTIKAKENEINAIINSTSWKITKPLRKIKGVVKNNKKGEKL